MIPTRDSESIIYSIEEEDTVPRLLLYTTNELEVDAADADALVRQAVAEVIQGQHRHHFERGVTLFSSLCAVLSLLAAQREPKDDTAVRVS
jgi:hypothetical protein